MNALYLIPGAVGGTEIYLRNVLSALAQTDRVNQYFVLRNRDTGYDLTPIAENFHDCPQPVSGRSRPTRLLYEQTGLVMACLRLHLDVLFNGGFTAPLAYPGPMVTVFHDLQYKRHPEYFRPLDLPFWRLMLPLSAARSNRIVVLSRAVKADLMEFYKIPESRIAVVPHGVEPEFARIAERRLRNPPSAKLLLSVSTLHPHKNLDGLLTAFARFRVTFPGWKLCLAGLKGFETAAIEARRKELGLEDAVTIPGWLPRSEIYDLFANAAGFVYPSKFEGFGIPVLEAMAAGVPVACSRLPSLMEFAEGFVRFFDPADMVEIAEALEALAVDSESRETLRAAGMQRARAFGWERSALSLTGLFEQTAYDATRSKKSQD